MSLLAATAGLEDDLPPLTVFQFMPAKPGVMPRVIELFAQTARAVGPCSNQELEAGLESAQADDRSTCAGGARSWTMDNIAALALDRSVCVEVFGPPSGHVTD